VEWLIGGIVGGVIAAVVVLMMRGKGSRDPGARADAFFAERDARQAKNRTAWLAMLERLPVVGGMSQVLHTPVYDCSSDEFELPCVHDRYDLRSSAVRGGFTIGFISMAEARTLIENLSDAPWPAVTVDAGDHLDLVYAASAEPSAPGGKVMRLVRTGADEFQVYGWRCGMRTGVHDDPSFDVAKIVARPQLWLDRLQTLRSRWPQNSNYVAASRRCPHRGH
jgi:hypothetical protein